MDTKGKKIQVNASSIFDLKAELIRKQQEYKQAKTNDPSDFKPRRLDGRPKKVTIWDKQNLGVIERSQRDVELTVEEEDIMTKSRKALEAKTKLYESLSSSLPADESNQEYLVDFQRKAIDNINEKKKNQDISDEADSAEDVPAPSPDDEWVDYTDSLGRSRRCLQKDLPHLLEMDRNLGGIPSKIEGTSRISSPDDLGLLSEDMKREFQRKKWEKEAEEAIKKPVGPVHYQTVQHDEIRSHGVGYYGFSKDEKERKEQMDELFALRKQAEEQRLRRERTKEKRKQLLKARIKKVRQRKKRQLGMEESESEGSTTENSDTEKVAIEDIPLPLTEPQIGPPVSNEAEPSKVRPWDVGKMDARVERPKHKKQMTGEEWIEKQRSERVKEFAPPQFYYNS